MSSLPNLDDEPPAVLVGASPPVARLRDQVRRVARTPRTTVLLTGEPGLELEQVARAVHAASELAAGPFLRADCQRPAGSVEELFQRALAGSLFFQEVSALAPDRQEHLLALLESRAGGDAELRIIASTSRDLDARVEAGLFREDLFYRLNVLTIRVPALRERAADVPELAARVLARVQRTLGARLQLHPSALEALAGHDWPANLFELETVLARSALRAENGVIGPDDLDLSAAGPRPPERGVLAPVAPSGRSLRAVEEATIRRVLDEEGGNRSRAARVLGINRTTLYNKLRQYGIA